MSDISIDWASAEVVDGKLTVGFDDKPPKDWTERFQAVIDRLSHPGNDWGAIKLAKGKLQVDEVQPGAESDLRHFLDSALLQTNAGGDDGDSEGDSRSERDQALTDAFRAFADS
jgi:hypothetical protein